MSNPRISVLERIMQHIEEALRGITHGAGYSQTVRQVWRFRNTEGVFEDNAPNLSAYCLSDVPQEGTIAGDHRTALVVVEGALVPQTSATLDAELIAYQDDIYRAMKVDGSRGGVARDTQLGGVTRGLVKPGVGIVQMQFHVSYAYREGDPSQPL